MIFPLPLTPFEEYMLADDRPQWPMSFFLRLELRGQYDPAILTSALTAALARHPLLASLLADDGGGGLQWVAGPGVPPPVSFARAGCELDFPEGRQIDLRRRIGVRVWVRSDGADEWTLWLQFHHACCDGLGAMQFVGDVLAAYPQAEQRNTAIIRRFSIRSDCAVGDVSLDILRRYCGCRKNFGVARGHRIFLAPSARLDHPAAEDDANATPSRQMPRRQKPIHRRSHSGSPSIRTGANRAIAQAARAA